MSKWSDMTPAQKDRRKAYQQTPEYKAYQKAYRKTPERKAWQNAYLREYIAERQMWQLFAAADAVKNAIQKQV
jgi:uncharacterized protein YeaO (DUF488 family)